MIDTMSRTHDEDVTGWILRPHFNLANKDKIVRNPTNEGKTVRNPTDQGKNLKCSADEDKIIRIIVLRHDNYRNILQESL